MALLRFENRDAFATGATAYNTTPGYALSDYIVILVSIGESMMIWEAVIDLTSPYLTLSRGLANDAGIRLDRPETKAKSRIQGKVHGGMIYTVDLTLMADTDKGENVTQEVLAFVPNSKDFDPSPLPPTIIGLQGCLDRFFFAVDPFGREFFFG